jgi:hypothetical protein
MRLVFIHVAALMTASFALALPVHSQQNTQPPANSPATTDKPKVIVDQSLSGGVYRSGGGHFTLTVPDGWKTDDDIVEPQFGVGGLSSPGDVAHLEIQQFPTQDTPATLARKIFDKGDSVFHGYHKLSESQLEVAGRRCEVVTFAWSKQGQVGDASIEVKLVERMVLMPDDFSIFVFKFAAPEALFDKQLPAFDEILKTFHSTAKEDFSKKPK